MITMPNFSEPVEEREAKRLCALAADEFKHFRESAGYKIGETPALAFVKSETDKFGNYQDSIFFDNLGIYIVRLDVKDFSVVFKKTPEINESGIRPDFPLSESERGSLLGEYQAYTPILSRTVMKRREEQFKTNLYHL